MTVLMQLLQGIWASVNLSEPYKKDDVTRMKSNVMFRDQLNNVTSLFDQWNECEQAVAVCCLLHKLGAIQARFLALVLDHSLAGCAEALKIQEQEANDPGYIHSLRNKTKDDALVHLLSHLPLLQPCNEDAKREYLGLITKIITHSVRNGIHLEESRQLLSYCLLHPAISPEDRRALSVWLPHLDDHVNSPIYNCHLNGTQDGAAVLNGSLLSDRYLNRPYGSESRLESWQNGGLNMTESPGAVVNGNGSYGDLNSYPALNGLGSNSLPPGIGANHLSLHAINSCPPAGLSSISSQGGNQLSFPHCRIRRSNSLTPPSGTNLQSNLQLHRNHSQNHSSNNDWATSTENGAVMQMKPQQVFSSDHAPLSPQSSVASSGSSGECHVEDTKNSFNTDGSGMKDVPLWLKGLRLHKYSYLFANMTYEEMMDLTEAKLEAMNVTKGARRKIYLSIQKLKERQNNLKALEKEIENGESVRNALTELKAMIQTPMKRYTGSSETTDSSSQEESADNVEPLPNSSDIAQLSSSPQENGVPTSELDANSAVAEGDLPGQFTRLMGKICTNLLVSPSQPDDENRNLFLMLIDKCLGHEVFTPTQKRRLFSWKQQVQKVWHPLPPRRTLENRLNRGKWSGPHSGTNGSLGQGVEFNNMAAAGSAANRWHPSQQFSQQASSSLQQQTQQQQQAPPPQQRAVHSRQQGLLANHLSSQQRSSHVVKRPSLQDHLKPHVPVQRTHSAPVRPNPPSSSSSSLFGKPGEADNSGDPEINTRLESLCLSVTEHALGGLDGASPY